MRWPRTKEIWIAATILAAILVWTGRFFVNPDGISYLDLSDDIASGRFGAAVNAHWSPAYPYLLALWLAPFESGSVWEPVAVHVLNGLLFLAALATFELFLRELRRGQTANEALSIDSPSGKFAAYMVVLWCTLVLITIRAVTPDMMLAAIGFAAATLFVRIHSGHAGTRSLLGFGALLGIAALTKSFMLWVGLVFLAHLVVTRRTRASLLPVIVFLAVISPQLIALSRAEGRPTFGSSGKIAYVLKVSRVSKLDSGFVVFPTDMGNRTYVPWSEPAARYATAPVRFSSADQLRALKTNAVTDFGIGLKILVPLLIIIACRDRNLRIRHRMLAWISVAVIVAYGFIHSEARLIGFWIALGSLTVLTGATLDQGTGKLRIGRLAVNAIAIISFISFITYVIDQSFSSRIDRGLKARNLQLEVAQALKERGVPRGSRVALLGDESDLYWARLAGVQVVAQIPSGETTRYREQLRSLGAKAIVASWTTPPANEPGWVRVPETEFSILPIQ